MIPREIDVRFVLRLIKDGQTLARLDEVGVWHSQHPRLERQLNEGQGLKRRFAQKELYAKAEPVANYFGARIEWEG